MSALTSGPWAYLGKQFHQWRLAHGYAPGLTWSPAAWQGRGQRCGCAKPCGWYVRPERRPR